MRRKHSQWSITPPLTVSFHFSHTLHCHQVGQAFEHQDQVSVAMLGRRGLAEEGLKEYLLHRDAKTPALKSEVESLPAKDVQLLNLGYDWLYTYLPHVMQKIDRVTFGIMTDAQSEAALEAQPLMPLTRTKLAIPFVGKVCARAQGRRAVRVRVSVLSVI